MKLKNYLISFINCSVIIDDLYTEINLLNIKIYNIERLKLLYESLMCLLVNTASFRLDNYGYIDHKIHVPYICDNRYIINGEYIPFTIYKENEYQPEYKLSIVKLISSNEIKVFEVYINFEELEDLIIEFEENIQEFFPYCMEWLLDNE